MKIGLIFCAYNYPEYLDKSLAPWLELRAGGQDLKIAAVSCQFKEYADFAAPPDTESPAKLAEYLKNNQIDFLWANPETLESEAQIRNRAAQYLLSQNVDVLILADCDEMPTAAEIENALEYIQSDDNKFYAWFGLSYRNLTFNEFQYTKFSPPRIFRTKLRAGLDKLRLKEIYYDNDVNYVNSGGQVVNYQQLTSKLVPPRIFNAPHYSWLSNEKSKQKVLYQEKHFAHGAGCGFRWNNELDRLEFNPDYFKKTGQPLPEIFDVVTNQKIN